MTHLFKRAAALCALLCGLTLAAPALADCTTATSPNTAGTTGNATYEATVKVCETVAAAGATAISANTLTGALTETAPASDTASSGLNGRLQRLAQRLTTIIAGIPLTAGEAHIGEVGGNIIKVAVSPTVSASPAYSSGDVMGGLLTFANVARVAAGSGLLQSVTLNFKSAQTAATDFVWCGGDNPSGTTLTDNAAVAVAAADYNKCRVVHVTDCTGLGTPSVCAADNLAFPFALSSGTTGYGFLVTRGTPTLASTSDVEVALRILRN